MIIEWNVRVSKTRDALNKSAENEIIHVGNQLEQYFNIPVYNAILDNEKLEELYQCVLKFF